MFCHKPYLFIYCVLLNDFLIMLRFCINKQPSRVSDVSFKSPSEDTKAKKNIVNVAVGMLGKGTNKRGRSLNFESLSEAVY